MADFEIGDVVKGKKFGPMDHDFTGIVEKVYNNSIMVSIHDFDPADKSGVNELNGRAVLRQKETKMIKAVPRKEKDENEDDKGKKSKTRRTRTRTSRSKKSTAKAKTTKKRATKAKTSRKKTTKKSTKKADK
ncbi:hypothetical protein [Limosilactobacillus sp.]|uniref:hypothetical protein n=1 Tax=Limosilactobacillus sp. TaxID=2773925 RepID=UPI00359FB9F8